MKDEHLDKLLLDLRVKLHKALDVEIAIERAEYEYPYRRLSCEQAYQYLREIAGKLGECMYKLNEIRGIENWEDWEQDPYMRPYPSPFRHESNSDDQPNNKETVDGCGGEG